LDNSADLYIGKDSTGNYYQGILDSVLIYKGTVLGLAEIISRESNGPEFLVAINKNTIFAPIVSLNDAANGNGLIAGILSANNFSGFPLKIWNNSSYLSGSDTIYNLLSFGDINSEYGNLAWDSTNSQFILSQSLKITGDLTANYLKTNDNQFLAFDAIRYTLTSDDVGHGYITVPWGKTTTKKVASMHAVIADESDTNDTVYSDQESWTNNIEQAINYDGTNITVIKIKYGGGIDWEEGDIVTIFVAYEK